MAATASDALRRFLPAYLEENPSLLPGVRRAAWAVLHCRTPVMGGHLWDCGQCGNLEYHCHSCNHRNCPLCGKAGTADWVSKQLEKRVGAPYFMVNFTLPAQLRQLFRTRKEKEMYDLFFAAVSEALRATLADKGKGLGAQDSGFTLVLHTWNQRLLFHPHIHAIVPGAGLDVSGNVVTVQNENFLLKEAVLRRRFIQAFRKRWNQLDQTGLPKIPGSVWRKCWGVKTKPFGNGANLVKYLGAYVCRKAIGDRRVLKVTDTHVTFRWKDRAHGGVEKTETLPGTEFAARYFRHVLPSGLKAVRHYGFCHPAAKAKREKIALHTGLPLDFSDEKRPATPSRAFQCSCCGGGMKKAGVRLPQWKVARDPPARPPPATAA